MHCELFNLLTAPELHSKLVVMNSKRVAVLFKWFSRIVFAISLLWILFFAYLFRALGDFFGPTNWTAVFLVALVGIVVGLLLRWVSRRLIGREGADDA